MGALNSFFSRTWGALKGKKECSGGGGVFFNKRKKLSFCHILVLCLKGGS